MTAIDLVVAGIKASISASGVSENGIARLENKIARLLASTATAALKVTPKTVSTQEQAEKAAPGVYRVKGAVGLHLKKTTATSGAWSYRFRFGDRRPEMGLGAIADVPLTTAIDEALRLRLMVRSGVNPIVARRATKTETSAKAQAAANKRVFKQAVEEYVAAHASSWKHPASRRLWLNPVVKYAYPVIGAKMLDDIRVEDIVAIMDATVEKNAPTAGPRVRLRVEQVINAAIALGQRSAALGNPAATKLVKAVRPTAKDADEHFRRLPLGDAPGVFCKLMEFAVDSTAFAAWVWTIATASRPGEEALKARWEEIDLANKLWIVPAQRMKGAKGASKEHKVPLSSLALQVLKWQAERRTGDAVFPGSACSPLSYTAFSRAPAKAGIDAGSPHSWRSIWRDWAEDIGGIAPQTAEAALAHSLGKVERAYRRETGVPARAVAIQRYADWLEGKGANVIAFPARAVAAE
jgi:integrase